MEIFAWLKNNVRATSSMSSKKKKKEEKRNAAVPGGPSADTDRTVGYWRQSWGAGPRHWPHPSLLEWFFKGRAEASISLRCVLAQVSFFEGENNISQSLLKRKSFFVFKPRWNVAGVNPEFLSPQGLSLGWGLGPAHLQSPGPSKVCSH